MTDQRNTGEQPMGELAELRQRVAELEALEAEHRRTEEELLLKSIVFDSSSVATLIADNEGLINHANSALLSMWRYGTRDEATGKSIASLFVNEEDALPIITALNETGEWSGEFLARRTDGSTFISWFFATVVRSEKGEQIGYQAANIDVTARELAMAEQMDQLAKFPRDNPNPVLRVAPDGTFLYANEASFPLLNFWGCQDGQPLPDDWHRFALDVLSSGLGKETQIEVEDRTISLTFAPVVDEDYVNVYGLDVTERTRAQEILMRQTQEILDISTPVMQVWEGVVVAPLIGTLDSQRTQRFMEVLLERIVETQSDIALVDITGVPTVDTQTAYHLIETISAVRLLGAKVVLTGVRPAIAQTLVHLGIDLSGITTRSSLVAGLRVALNMLGLQMVGKT